MQPIRFMGNALMGRCRDVSGDLHGRSKNEVVVLHAFRKKTQATSRHDIDIAKERYAQLTRSRE
jgi:hypothetical protein